MKKALLLLSLSLLFSITSAQDWRPIPDGYKAHFSYNSADLITHSLWVDSMKVENGDSVFYMNRAVGICDTCTFSPNNCSSCVYHLYWHQFLQGKMIQRADSSWLFDEPSRFDLLPFAKIHQSWTFDSVNQVIATIDTIVWDSVFQVMDSVKYISLSNGRQLVLSQNHGVLHFPDRKPNKEYELVGLEGPNREGKQVPGFWEIYDFQVGDIICQCEGEGDFGSASGWSTCTKNTILSRRKMGDTIIFDIYKKWIHVQSFSGESFYSSGEGASGWRFINRPGHSSNQYPGEFIQLQRLYPDIQNYEIIKDSRWGIGKGYGNRLVSSNPPLTPIFGYPSFYTPSDNRGPYYEEASFFPTLGRTYYEYHNFEQIKYFHLEGYIRNGDSVGTIRDDGFYFVSVDPVIESLPFTIAPNPTSGITHLHWETPRPVTLSIHNTLGQRIRDLKLTGRQSYALDLSDSTPGLYFIRLTAGDQSAVKRLVLR